MSLDRTPETEATERLTVRWEGGVEGTQFGKDLLEADLFLKRLTLEENLEVADGVYTYAQLAIDHGKREGARELINTRFWFFPRSAALAARDGVAVINELKIGVRTEVEPPDPGTVDISTPLIDLVGEEFADTLTAEFESLRRENEVLARLKGLYDLVALARGIELLPTAPDLDYWIEEYQVPAVETPMDYPLQTKRLRVPVEGGREPLHMTLEGGIQLRALATRLRAGDATAVLDAVLLSRPDGNPLTWEVPLAGWAVQGVTPEDEPEVIDDGRYGEDLGTSVERRIDIPERMPGGVYLDVNIRVRREGGGIDQRRLLLWLGGGVAAGVAVLGAGFAVIRRRRAA